MKVLVTDNISEIGVNVLKEAQGLEIDVKPTPSPDDLKAMIGQYHGLAIRGATKVTAEIIAAATNLKVVGRAGTGLDNVDIPAASKRGIVVMNTPGGNSVATAEHTLSMMMALARNIPQASASMKAGLWEKKKFGGTELYNKTLGVVGMGKIGSIVADRAMGMGMKVLGYDPFLSSDQMQQMGVTEATLDEIFRQSDFITLHVPLNNETKGMINTDNIAKMKTGVRIINCARGPIFNTAELAEAVKSGKVAGVAMDVYPVEPPEDKSLIDLPQVICTPHLGAATSEAQVNVAVAVAGQIKDYLVNGTIRNAVNAPAVSGEMLPRLQPYLDLSQRLGLFLGQSVDKGTKTIEALYAGDVTELDVKPITTSFLTGFLTPALQDEVNQVNAPVVAAERGIVVSESKTSKSEDFQSLLRFKVITESRDYVVEGTLFGRSEPRMVRYGAHRGEFDLSGDIIVIQALDKPGVIGRVGTTLGAKGINISHLQFARQEAGGSALLFLNTDSRADDAALAALMELEHIAKVRRLSI
ncbi:MAG: phosphoglycerate dehydrogenase [Thermodesulfobacteriota bacterium]